MEKKSDFDCAPFKSSNSRLACHHHVYKLQIKHVAEVVMGKINSRSEGLFRRFKKKLNSIDQDVNDLCLFDFSEVFNFYL